MSDLLPVVINALEEVKALNTITLNVKSLTGITDHMVITSGNSNRQVKALANNVIVEGKKAGFTPVGIEGDDTNEWILVDFGDVIVHVMLPATREFYELEKLWTLRPSDVDAGEQSEHPLDSGDAGGDPR